MKQFIRFYTKYIVFLVLAVCLVFNTFTIALADSSSFFQNNNIHKIDETTRSLAFEGDYKHYEKDNGMALYAIHIFAKDLELTTITKYRTIVNEEGVRETIIASQESFNLVHILQFNLVNSPEEMDKLMVNDVLKFDVWGLGTASLTAQQRQALKPENIRLRESNGTVLVSLNDLNTFLGMCLTGYDFNNYNYWLKTCRPYTNYKEIIKIRK